MITSVSTMSDQKLIDLPRSNDSIVIEGPYWQPENVLMPPGGYWYFELKITKSTSKELVTIFRRYSDFDLLRQALECLYPGLFIYPLPPKDTFIFFKKEDSKSLTHRKNGITNFLDVIKEH